MYCVESSRMRISGDLKKEKVRERARERERASRILCRATSPSSQPWRKKEPHLGSSHLPRRPWPPASAGVAQQ